MAAPVLYNNGGSTLYKRRKSVLFRRKIIAQHTRSINSYQVPFLYKFLSVFLTVSTITFCIIFGMKMLLHAICFFWKQVRVSILSRNIIIESVIKKRNCCLVFDFMFNSQAVAIKAATCKTIFPLTFYNTFECSALKYR